MRDYITLGPTPCEEPCQQVGTPGYNRSLEVQECWAYVKLLRWYFGEEPSGAHLSVKSFPHDFGTYHEVVCWYEEGNEASSEYAFRCESDGPLTWKCKRPDGTEADWTPKNKSGPFEEY